MKKFFLCTMASLMTVFAMAIGRNDGSTKANAIDFDWDKGVTQPGDTTLWYRVNLDPLYEEEDPSLTLYLTNPSNVVGSSVDVSMTATVAGQEESKKYTIAARQYKTYTANAKALITLQQNEIYLTLTTEGGEIKLSAKVFESEDLDETCKDARTLAWSKTEEQQPMYSAWWKINLKNIKDTANVKKDAKVTIKNIGAKTVNLKAGQSLDCPSSGVTKRNYELAPKDSIVDTIPQSMILSVQPEELYFGLENVESEISIRVDYIDQPEVPVIPGEAEMAAVAPLVNPKDTTMESLTIPVGTTLYRFSVAELNAFNKYEPEFTYRNENEATANVTIKMAFMRPTKGTTNTFYEIEPGKEEIVVYKKNMLDGLEGVDSIYLLTTTNQPITFLARYKHVREGKACKTNIDFNWETGHTQEGRTTQWYAIAVDSAKEHKKDIMVYLYNQGHASATVKASMAFSCPYIDLQEVTRSIALGDTVSRRMPYSTYAMMSDTVWIGLETNQDIRFWADTVDAQKKAEVDYACENAEEFDWKDGVKQKANEVKWYKIIMDSIPNKDAKFPTVFVQNMSSTAPAVITAEMSLECPDSIENEQRTMTIEANGSYTKKLARTMFENIVQDEIYLRVVSTQDISLQIRLNEEAEGTSCRSAIPFNWTSGNTQAANSNLWYQVDLRKAMKDSLDLNLTIENLDAVKCHLVGQLTFGCPDDEAASVQTDSLAPKQKKTIFRPHSSFQLLPDNIDSIVYINLQGNTSMRISAEYVTPAPFEKIKGEGIVLDTLLLDSKISTLQKNAEQWYLIPKEEIKHMRDTIQQVPLTPNIHLENIGSESLDVTIEVAFAFPVIETMISQKVKVPGGERKVHALDYKLFKQAITKFDSVLVRITVPEGKGNTLRIRSGLDKAFDGNTPEKAAPIVINDTYIQEGNTEMWYKLKTADLKKDLSLINKSIEVRTANLGSGTTTIKLEVYEGLQSKVDMFEQYGLPDSYRERKVKKGEERSHNFPFQNLLLVGDLELYIKVTTTEKIMFTTKIAGEYASITPDPAQQDAKLLVPNVDYFVPGDNQPHWYQICIPYIRDNYKYTHVSSLTYEWTKEATLEVTNTLMDTMKYNFPTRKTTRNKANKHYVDTTLLCDLLSKGIARYSDQKFDITSFKEEFVDSMLHRYITSDSLTMYIRYKTTADMKVRLNMEHATGNVCLKPVKFDWEHGFVNAPKETNWILVEMNSTKIPEGKDLKIHMDRWADTLTNIKATLHIGACSGDDIGSVSKQLDKDTFRTIERKFMEISKWPNLMIQYYSDTTTHIWAEFVDTIKLDKIFDTIKMLVCPGYSFDTARTIYSDTIFNVYRDSVEKSAAKYHLCETNYQITVYKDPKLPKIDAFKNKLVIAVGSPLDVSAVTTEIFNDLKGQKDKDSTLAAVAKEDITWEYSLDGSSSSFIAMPPAPVLNKTSIALRYKVTTECGTELNSLVYKNPGYATVDTTLCGPLKNWFGNTYDKIGKDTIIDTIAATANLDSIVTLYLTITPDTRDTLVVSTCKAQYEWHGSMYNTPGVYDTVTLDSCYYACVLKLQTMTHEEKADSVWACNDTTLYGITFKKDTNVVYDTIRTADLCDSIIITHNIFINHPLIDTLPLIGKYGDRLLMINRKMINDSLEMYLDDSDETNVKWYCIEANGDTTYLKSGFYLTNPDGSQNGMFIKPGKTYFAMIEKPAVGDCGFKAQTRNYTTGSVGYAPAIVPSLARPGEDIRIINLNPDEETTIRIYTSEGMIQGTYTVRGEEFIDIQAAKEHGFYLVELRAESIKSTLRYIVK